MDTALQKYYEDRFEMMGSQGWKDLMMDVQDMVNSTNNLDGVDKLETLHFRKGEISIMKWLLNLSNISEDAYRSINESS